MDISEYQEATKRTCSLTEQAEMLKLALIGMQGELGEIADPIKKYLWHGHNLDHASIQGEVGDIFWYLATLCNALDISLEDALRENIEKLYKRYPDGFSSERSIHRTV